MPRKSNKSMNQQYRDEGWGVIAEDVLGIEPVSVNADARAIAQACHDELSARATTIAHLNSVLDDETRRLKVTIADRDVAMNKLHKNHAHATGLILELQLWLARARVAGVDVPKQLSPEAFELWFNTNEKQAPEKEAP